jgi:hypothetical protein
MKMKNRESSAEAEVPELLVNKGKEQIDWKLALWQLSLQKTQSAHVQQ